MRIKKPTKEKGIERTEGKSIKGDQNRTKGKKEHNCRVKV